MGWSPTIACVWVKGSVAMLVADRFAGVASEVNQRNPSHTGDETCKQGNNPDFETQVRGPKQVPKI